MRKPYQFDIDKIEAFVDKVPEPQPDTRSPYHKDKSINSLVKRLRD